MSAAVLLHGKVFRDPQRKTSTKGKEFATATVRDGQGDDAVWWRVFAFGADARDELLALRDGDSVAVAGTLKAELYAKPGAEPRVSLTVMADRVVTAKRQKREHERTVERPSARKFEPAKSIHAPPPFDDSVPF